MAMLYVLNVPEFEPLRLAAGRKAGIDVTAISNYTCISASGELCLLREETGLGKAIWYGALTGGYLGRIARFDDEQLAIVDD
jgi:hypothetical protein